MGIFISLLIFIGVPVLIVYLLYLASHYDWRGRKIQKAVLEERKEKENIKLGQGLGAILVLGSIGTPFMPAFSSLPLYINALVFLFGIALIWAANRSK